MSLVTRQGKGEKLTIEEMDGNLTYLEGLGRPYKVYTALLTQSDGDDIQGQYSGTLIIGRTYEILDVGDPAGDWTNVGAPNNEIGTKFVATGTTPNSWGDGGGLSYNSGAPVVTVLENTIGNIWFTFSSDGVYFVYSDNKFLEEKTLLFYSSYSGTNLDVSPNVAFGRINDSAISLIVNDGNGFLNKTPIEIRVYN